MFRDAARPHILKLQRALRLLPRAFCLISGAPRSGTTALVGWLRQQPPIAAFQESRILVGIHRFMEGVHGFKNLERDRARIINLARTLVVDYYAGSRVLLGKSLLVDKEPLEPIAFPSKDYARFLTHVRELFPDSKMLFVVRDPVATIWSMSERTWGESLTDIARKQFTIEEYAENWRSCAELVLQYATDPGTCIVQFGRLVNDSGNESRRILEFLNVRNGVVFEPRQTKETGFSRQERERILRIVQPQLDLLRTHGLSDLD